MRIIIAGDGKVGSTLTKKLSAEGHDLILIDSKQRVLDTSIERYDVMAVNGNCASMETLKEADVMNADLLIAVTNADEINLLCCMTAHSLNENIHTIARIRNPEYSSQVYKMRDLFGLSMSVNPERQAAVEIGRLLKYPAFLRRDTFARGRAEIIELRIDRESKLCNVALNDLNSIIKCKVLVFAVRRDDEVLTPDGKFVLREGDHIFATAESQMLTVLLKNLGIITHRMKRVILCGGGRVSYYLAQELIKNGITVQLIEKEEERCIELANELPAACVVNGDASSQHLLQSEDITGADAVVTLTGLDEMNMIVSLYAKKCGVRQVITKVGHMDNSSIHDSLGLGSIVCPKELCSNHIVRYVRAMENKTGAALTVHSIADGMAEALEFRVDEKTMHCGEQLKHVKTRKNVLLVSITRGNKTEIPNGESSFELGDSIIIVASGGVVIHQINDIFEK